MIPSIFTTEISAAETHCRISEEEYVKAIKEEISKVVKLQEELDIDVLVHGEPEVREFCRSIRKM